MNNYNNYGYAYPYFGNNYGYGVQPQQQSQQYYHQQQPMQNAYQQPMQKYSALTYVSGLVGAKSHILNPNEKIYLLDSDNPILYVKSADYEGKYNLEAFKLTPMKIEDVGKEEKEETKINMNELALKSDLKSLEERLDKITALLEGAE